MNRVERCSIYVNVPIREKLRRLADERGTTIVRVIEHLVLKETGERPG